VDSDIPTESSGQVQRRVSVARPALPADDRFVSEYTAFYIKIVPPLTGYLIKLGARPSLAAEIVQETMLSAAEQWEAIEDRPAWCRKVASNNFFKQHYSADESNDGLPDDDAGLVAKDVDLDGIIMARFWIYPLLNELPMKQRATLALHLDGLSNREIAKVLDSTPELVSRNLSHAKLKMQSLIKATKDPKEGRS
jgi:RNA polymerase sigma-70 factor (ECF subfamily)